MKRKISLFALGFMMVFALFNLGVAQAEELPYKITVSETVGQEKATVKLFNTATLKPEDRDIEFTIVPSGAKLSFLAEKQYANLFQYVEEDGVYRARSIDWKSDEASKMEQGFSRSITLSYNPRLPKSFYSVRIGSSSQEIYYKVSDVKAESSGFNKDLESETLLKNIQVASKGGEIKLTYVQDERKNDSGSPLFIARMGAELTFSSNRPVLGGMHILYQDSFLGYYPDAQYVDETLELGERMERLELSNMKLTLKPGAYDAELIIVERIDDPDEGLGDYFAKTEHFTIYVLPNSDGEQAAKPTTTSEKQTAKPTSARVVVNGKQMAFEAYTINGNNFFKLRDLAMAVKGSDKQFEVSWDAGKNAINLISASRYTPVGGEMAVSDQPKATTGKLTTSKIYKDGQEVQLTAYNIGGNNYFKLRDIAQAFNIGVTWDGKAKTIAIDTAIDYIPE